MSERNPIFAELCEAIGYHAAQIAGTDGMAPNTCLIRTLGKVEVTLAPSQERIDALELEVRQLTEQIVGLRGALIEIVGMPTSHATVPVRDYAMQDIAKAALAASKEVAAPAQPALSAALVEQQMVAYLDIGAGGYIDLGSELPDEALLRLPKGRHALVIAGTFGIDGYVAAKPTPAPQADSVLEDAARYLFLRDGKWRDTDLEPVIRLQLNSLWDAKIDAARKQGGA